jgi:hypothetical protein
LIKPLVAGQTANLARFDQAHLDARHIVQEWRDRAYQEEQAGPAQLPIALVFGWLAFNGWAMCVTRANNDADCIRHLAADVVLARRFGDMRQHSADFSDAADAFARQWPVLSSKDYRRLIGDPFATPPTPALVDQFTRTKSSKFEPRCHVDHVNARTTPDADWAHTIWAIYQVRCNLLHGEKTTHLPRDRDLIASSGWILLRFIDGTLGQPGTKPLF